MKRVFIFFILSFAFVNASNKELNISACGVTRVAFVKKLAKEFSKEYNISVHLNKKGGVNRAINGVLLKKGRYRLWMSCII